MVPYTAIAVIIDEVILQENYRDRGVLTVIYA